MNPEKRMHLIPRILCFVAFFTVGKCFAQNISSNTDISCHISVEHGDYEIIAKHLDWKIGGSLSIPMHDPSSTNGTDRIGPYQQINFTWQDNGRRAGTIRLYRDKPIVIFSEKFIDPVDHAPVPFPVLNQLPSNLLTFRYGNDAHLHPLSFDLKPQTPDEQYGGPFCLFDDRANAIVISPASNFMVAMLSGDLDHGIASGLNRTLKSIPAGYTQQTILVVDHGINRTWSIWGHALTDLYGRTRPANDADVSLKYLSYWTDNGAAYYYNYDLSKGYANTILAIKDHLDKVGVSIHSMQLDSWWYPKTFKSVQSDASNKPRAKDPRLPAGTWNRYGGLLTYTPDPDLFPNGLKPFDQKLDLPLITHNRWIDPTSPYWRDYKISGIAPIDPKWWNKIISDIADWGVTIYEQDWNNYIYNLSPDLSNTTWAGDAFMDGMANACAKFGLTMQYCMILPRNLMQGGAKYSNLTTVRLASDRFERGKWREFIYGSQMASALGVWPWADVFKSNETANILLCDLSAGIVGLSDKIGEENISNIFRCARKDGVIVKPDEPLVPLDQTFIAEAKGKKHPLICAVRSGDCVYLFTFQSKPGHGSKDVEVVPKSLGMSGKVFTYDYFNKTGQLVDSAKKFSPQLNEDDWAYDIISPVGKSQIALIGDLGLFATRGSQRIAEISDQPGKLHLSLLFAAGESDVTLGLYAPTAPEVQVKNGSSDKVQYNASTGIAQVKITVDPDAKAEGVDSTKTVDVEFDLH